MRKIKFSNDIKFVTFCFLCFVASNHSYVFGGVIVVLLVCEIWWTCVVVNNNVSPPVSGIGTLMKSRLC